MKTQGIRLPPSCGLSAKLAKHTAVIFPLVVLILSDSGIAQSFQNLNFESANIPGATQFGSMVPISDGLPGWSGYIGGIQQAVVYYDLSALDTSRISIIDHGAPFIQYPGVLQGKYTALLLRR